MEFDTRPLRDQLGASSSARTLSERDTLFEVWGLNSSMPTSSYSFVNDLLWNPQGADDRQLEITVSCQNCYQDEQQEIPQNLSVVTLPPLLGSLVADVVAETGNPALAWQALLTSTTRAAYYDWLPTFTAKSNISKTSMVYCQVPRHSRGFFIVVADMAVHLLLVAGTVIWFCKATCTTMISDAWHVVGHFKSRGVNEMLEEVTVVDDSNVKEVIKNSEVLRRRRLRSVE
ncbi:hypothetical protein SLS55_006273 [Diplodia seriata]|uniref:Uncharacterized protein n=1 Tax=Diplodia seriata TaxID=420778 RepID=A0ABR3CE14_9PEZI